MVQIEFASSIQRYTPIDPVHCTAETLKVALEEAFERQPELRGYVLDDQGAVRKHISIFVNDRTIADRDQLSDTLQPGDSVYVIQALSGG
jgi:molybdopterin converting factor small subunit